MPSDPNQALQSISPVETRRFIAALQGVRHPVTTPQALEQVAGYIYEALDILGYDTRQQEFLETPHYHQPSDTLETLNLDFVVHVYRAAAVLAIELAGGVYP